MKKYIDADRLCEFARNHIDKKVDANDIMRFPYVNSQEIRYGTWKHGEKDAIMRCSECNNVAPTDGHIWLLTKYCPNCGANCSK